MSFKTFIIKVLVFILNLLSSKEIEVDIQQRNVPKFNVTY